MEVLAEVADSKAEIFDVNAEIFEPGDQNIDSQVPVGVADSMSPCSREMPDDHG